MITCPNCKATLPDWAKSCQFCQSDTTQVLRPKQQAPSARTFEIPAWVWAAYYGISGWLLLDPAINAIKIFSRGQHSKEGLGVFEIAILIFLGVQMIVALGLLLRIQAVRAVVNFLCYLGIAGALFGLAGSLFGQLVFGLVGVLWTLYEVFRLVMYGMLIYLIGETDKAAY